MKFGSLLITKEHAAYDGCYLAISKPPRVNRITFQELGVRYRKAVNGEKFNETIEVMEEDIKEYFIEI